MILFDVPHTELLVSSLSLGPSSYLKITMQQFGTFSLNLLYIILLLVPGLLAIDVYLRVTKQIDEYSRIRAIVYSIGASLLSLTILFFTTPLHFEKMSGVLNKYGQGFITFETLGTLSLFAVSIFILIHFILVLVLAALSGIVVNVVNDPGTETDRREAWDYIFQEVYDPDKEIRVVTTDGDVIQGQKNDASHSATRRDLFLNESFTLELGIDEEAEKTKVEGSTKIGDGVYIHEQNIHRIIFLQDDEEKDPDKDKLALLRSGGKDRLSYFAHWLMGKHLYESFEQEDAIEDELDGLVEEDVKKDYADKEVETDLDIPGSSDGEEEGH